MTGLIVLMVVIQAALLWIGYGILQEVRRVRELSEDQRLHTLTVRPNSLSVFVHATIYAIWCWRGTCWELDLASVPVGHEPGTPPKFQGSFIGQRVKSQCTRR